MVADSDALWLSIVSGLVFLAWAYHLLRAVLKWREERSSRAFRNAFIALMLQVGLLRIWIGSTVRAVGPEPVLETLQAVTAPLLTLLLLSGAFVAIYTWHHQSQ